MTLAEIRKLYRKCHTPAHVQLHMEAVSTVAVFIAKKIRENGHHIDVTFVRDLALLHDLMKAIAFKNYDPVSFLRAPTADDLRYWKAMKKRYRGHDVEATSRTLQALKERKLSAAVLSQQFDAITSKKYPLRSLEEKIVYYADKRVAHTEVTSLRARLEEGYKRYNGKRPKSKKIQSVELAIHMLEEEIFSLTGERI